MSIIENIKGTFLASLDDVTIKKYIMKVWHDTLKSLKYYSLICGDIICVSKIMPMNISARE